MDELELLAAIAALEAFRAERGTAPDLHIGINSGLVTEGTS